MWVTDINTKYFKCGVWTNFGQVADARHKRTDFHRRQLNTHLGKAVGYISLYMLVTALRILGKRTIGKPILAQRVLAPRVFIVGARTMADQVNLSEGEWKAKLTPVQFEVLRLKGTERAGTGEYNKHYEEGTYVCAGCKAPLYTSKHKFDSGCGRFSMPSPARSRCTDLKLLLQTAFDRQSIFGSVVCRRSRTLTAVARRSCALAAMGTLLWSIAKITVFLLTASVVHGFRRHMGHVFKGEGFKTPTDSRHCVNSVSLVFHAGEVPK